MLKELELNILLQSILHGGLPPWAIREKHILVKIIKFCTGFKTLKQTGLRHFTFIPHIISWNVWLLVVWKCMNLYWMSEYCLVFDVQCWALYWALCWYTILKSLLWGFVLKYNTIRFPMVRLFIELMHMIEYEWMLFVFNVVLYWCSMFLSPILRLVLIYNTPEPFMRLCIEIQHYSFPMVWLYIEHHPV